MKDLDLPEKLVADLAICAPTEGLIRRCNADRLTADKGAYLLVLGLPRRTRLSWNRRFPNSLPEGWYVYGGNAYGPGGIKARVSRHFRRQKPRHWHIDQLTGRAALYALPVPGGSECGLLGQLRESPSFGDAIPAFGSSDCLTCRSHLLAWRASDYQPGSMP